MKRLSLCRFYAISSAGVLLAAAYPLYMGVRVIGEMRKNGAVPLESYPKYVIPYAPLAAALVLGVLLMPVFQRPGGRNGKAGKWSFLLGALFSTGIFFIAERLMETKILVQTQEAVPLESWQMSLCYVPPDAYRTRTWEAVDVLLGGYSPAFKLHFYLISVILLIALLNSFYGFADIIRSGDHRRAKALAIQTGGAVAFLGMCIWACLTAFYRTGEITVSAISAALMAFFFLLMGVTAGTLIGSFTLGRAKTPAILLPAVLSSLTTLAMYGGEMILLSGNLYRFGTGFLFDGLGALVLAPVDWLIVLAAGAVTALLCRALNRGTTTAAADR